MVTLEAGISDSKSEMSAGVRASEVKGDVLALFAISVGSESNLRLRYFVQLELIMYDCNRVAHRFCLNNERNIEF